MLDASKTQQIQWQARFLCSFYYYYYFKAIQPERFAGNLICYKFNSPQWDINCIRQRKVQPPVELLTLGIGAKAMLLGSITRPLPCKASGNLTGPVDGLSWMGFGLNVP